MLSLAVTTLVTNLSDAIIASKLTDFLNIPFMFVTFPVLKLERSSEVSVRQDWNIYSMFVTFSVLIFAALIRWIDMQLENI